MAACHGDLADHCCHLGGVVCPWLEEGTVAGRRWACGLLRELGSWDRVHADRRHVERVQPALAASGVDVGCGDWPRPGEVCATCGAGD